MNGTAWLLIVLFVCSAAAFVAWRRKRRTNLRLTQRARKRRTSLEGLAVSEADDEVDEAEAYWGSALPRGLAAREIMEANTGVTDPGVTDSEALGATALASSALPEDSPGDGLEPALEAVPAVASGPDPAPASELGLHFLHWLAHHRFRLPDSDERYSEDHLLAAIERLEEREPSSLLDHGAALQKLGTCAVLFEPRLQPVDAASDVETLSRKLKLALGSDTLYLVLGATPETAEDEARLSAHIPQLLKSFDLPPERFFLKQPDGSFHNFIEDQRHYVPARIAAEHLPEAFLEQMLDYVHGRYEMGEPEAVIRVLGPLEEPLGTLALDGLFDRVLVARMLNLLGIAHREVGAAKLAVSCFMLAERLVKDPCEPDALQIVHSNMGETLAFYTEHSIGNLKSAAHHLREAIRLDDDDFDAFKALGVVYLEQFELTGRTSLLDRASRAFHRALTIFDDDEIHAHLAVIHDLKGQRYASHPGLASVTPISAAREYVENAYQPSLSSDAALAPLPAVGEQG